MDAIYTYVVSWDYILLLFLRVSALVFSSPIFGRRNIPAAAKTVYSLAIAYLFFMILPAPVDLDYNDDIVLFVLICIKEILFGIVMAYVLNLFFTLVFTAGQIIDMQLGFGMVNVFDVQSNLNVPLMGNFFNMIMLLVFFAVDGHTRLVEMIYISLVRVPIGSAVFSDNLVWLALELFVRCFLLAFYVALPSVSAGMLGEISLGIMMKSMPQLNAFSIGLPMRVVLGLVVILIVLPVYINFCGQLFDEMFVGLDNMFAALAG